jgi:hypothetical protein
MILIILAFFLGLAEHSEKIILPPTACFYFNESEKKIPVELGFNSNDEAQKIIMAIIDVVGLKPNFLIRSANVPNAAAVILKGERYILYNPDFIYDMDKVAGSRWASISILAHEIGHHLNGHTLNNTGSRPELELEADEFSGFVLRKMGATLTESQLAMKIAASQEASHTHPAKINRLAAIDKGWRHADNQMSGNRSVAIQKMKTPDLKMKIDEAEKQSVLDRKFIRFEVNFNFDPQGEYYVTIRNNLVKISKNNLIIIGKLAETSVAKIPYVLYQSDKNYLFVNPNGIVFTSDGEKAGYLRKPR